MRKLLFFSILIVISISETQSQIIVNRATKTKGSIPQSQPVSNSNTKSTTQNTSIYSLSSVRVNIRTGSDNKEFPSKVDLLMSCRSGSGFIYHQPGDNMRNEMKINSNTEFGLEKYPTVIQQNLTLESLQKEGLTLRIFYNPNFIADAWKIEGVAITLEFKDQNGVPHPTLGSKTIVFNNASGFLDAVNHTLMCFADGQFVPTTSSIQP
jgi:hypothetical protein